MWAAGWHELVHAYCHAFSSSDAVTLVLRTYVYDSADPSNVHTIHRMIAGYLDTIECRASPDEREARPRIVILAASLPYADLLRLYKSADCYVSAHWGEGWGLPIAEAMSMGVPAIATNFSGNTEFMNEANSFLVNYSLAPYPSTDEWFGDLQHAVADVDSLARTMRWVVNDRSERRRRGEQAMHDMVRLYATAIRTEGLGTADLCRC
jgi:glycosyltransferase involved in cell wall biosynthesis